MLRNIIGPSFDSKEGNCCLLVFLQIFEKSHFPCRKKMILVKQKRKKKKLGPSFDSQKKALFGPSFDSTTYVYRAYKTEFCRITKTLLFCSVISFDYFMYGIVVHGLKKTFGQKYSKAGCCRSDFCQFSSLMVFAPFSFFSFFLIVAFWGRVYVCAFVFLFWYCSFGCYLVFLW